VQLAGFFNRQPPSVTGSFTKRTILAIRFFECASVEACSPILQAHRQSAALYYS